MKTLFQTLLVITASIGLSQAEITDDTMRGLQGWAAEKLTIEVFKASKAWRPDGSRHTVEAKVTAVTASASGFKVGDKIEICYHITKAPGSYPNSFKKGESYKACLRLDEDVAGRGTFEAVK